MLTKIRKLRGRTHSSWQQESRADRMFEMAFYSIPAGVPHSDRCLGDEPFVMLDVFYPVRKDFIEKLGL